MKKLLSILVIQVVATSSFGRVSPEEVVANAIRENKEINSLVKVIEQNRGLQKCTAPSGEEVSLTYKTATKADFEAAYSCETMVIYVKGKAEVPKKDVLTIKLTSLSL